MIPAGIHQITAEEYHADPCATPSLSASIANLLVTRSPAHARAAHPKLNPDLERREAAHFDIGTAAHALLLEGRDSVVSLDFTDYRTKAAQQARDAARAQGLVPLLADQWVRVQEMVEAVRTRVASSEADPKPLTAGIPERTLVWEEDGVTCRALVDWLHDDHQAVDDVKTTSGSASPEAWSRTMFGIGADVQAAFYLRGLRRLTGTLDTEFRFVVCETFPPYAATVFTLSPDVLAVADAKVDYAIAKWAECLETDHWPAYPTRVCSVDLPPWEESRWLDREAREAA